MDKNSVLMQSADVSIVVIRARRTARDGLVMYDRDFGQSKLKNNQQILKQHNPR